MKKILHKTIAFIFLMIIISVNFNEIKAFAFPNLYSEGIYLMDDKTGTVLYEKNSDVQYMPASTTKVMTAIIAIENCKLDEKVTIGEKPPLVDGSAIGIAEGEVYTMEELLLGLLLESGNDCAEAIAEHIAGSNEAFAVLMNEKAKELGATNTNFKNPSGLSEEGHLTTAHDLALIIRYASQNEDFVRISRTPSHFYENHPFSDGSEKWVTNKNPLLKEDSNYKYQYVYCGKTGYTTAANHSYIATAIKDDCKLIGAFLNATDKDGLYTSVSQLFDWGFENFKTEKIISKGDELDKYYIDDSTSIPLLATEDVYYTLNVGAGENISTLNISVKYEDKDLKTKTIKKDEVLFNSSLLINDKEIANIDLASGIDREYTAKVLVKNTIINFISNNYPTSMILGFILIVILVITFISLLRYRYKRRKFLSRRSYIRNKHNF